MKKIIYILALMILVVPVLAEDVYMEVCLDFTENTIDNSCIELYEGLPNDPEYFFDFEEYYVGKVYSFDDEVLYAFNFSKGKNVYDTGLPVEVWFNTLSFPYYSNINRFEVWDDREVVYVLDLSVYAQCNQDNICDLNENIRTCPSDCDGELIEMEIVDEVINLEVIQEKPVKVEKSNFIYMVLILIVLLAVITLFVLKKKKVL
jgi:hypothetical protein